MLTISNTPIWLLFSAVICEPSAPMPILLKASSTTTRVQALKPLPNLNALPYLPHRKMLNGHTVLPTCRISINPVWIHPTKCPMSNPLLNKPLLQVLAPDMQPMVLEDTTRVCLLETCTCPKPSMNYVSTIILVLGGLGFMDTKDPLCPRLPNEEF